MTDFITIVAGVKSLKGDVAGTIINAGDLKSGTSKEGADWSRKDFVIQDESGLLKVSAWNEDIAKFKIGSMYEIINPQWSVYKEVPQITPSKFGSITCTGVSSEPINSAIKKQPSPLPKMETSVQGIVHCKIIEMLQIEKEVTEVFQNMCPREAQNGQKIGMYTRTIFSWLKSQEL